MHVLSVIYLTLLYLRKKLDIQNKMKYTVSVAHPLAIIFYESPYLHIYLLYFLFIIFVIIIQTLQILYYFITRVLIVF